MIQNRTDTMLSSFGIYCSGTIISSQTFGFNPFPSRLAKTDPFTILLCLMPDDFTHQRKASGWERVKLPMSKTDRFFKIR